MFFGASSEAAFYDTPEVTNLDSIMRPTNSNRFLFIPKKTNEPLKMDFLMGRFIWVGNYQFSSGLSVLEGAYHWALEVLVFFGFLSDDDVTI